MHFDIISIFDVGEKVYMLGGVYIKDLNICYEIEFAGYFTREWNIFCNCYSGGWLHDKRFGVQHEVQNVCVLIGVKVEISNFFAKVFLL